MLPEREGLKLLQDCRLGRFISIDTLGHHVHCGGCYTEANLDASFLMGAPWKTTGNRTLEGSSILFTSAHLCPFVPVCPVLAHLLFMFWPMLSPACNTMVLLIESMSDSQATMFAGFWGGNQQTLSWNKNSRERFWEFPCVQFCDETFPVFICI